MLRRQYHGAPTVETVNSGYTPTAKTLVCRRMPLERRIGSPGILGVGLCSGPELLYFKILTESGDDYHRQFDNCDGKDLEQPQSHCLSLKLGVSRERHRVDNLRPAGYQNQHH